MNVEEAYLVMHKASGIQVGDTVKVLRKAENYEMGWFNVWPIEIEPNLGYFRVTQDDKECGFRLNHRWRVPFFVLEVIKKAHTITIDGKDISLSEESFKALKKQLT